MGIYQKILIKHENVKSIISQVNKYYEVGKIEVLDFANTWRFLESIVGARTFVINQEFNRDVIQWELELENWYEFDEILRRITNEFKTTAILGYSNTTSGDFRFAFFNNGLLDRSLTLKYIFETGEVRLFDNFGTPFSFEKFVFEAPFTQNISNSNKIYYPIFDEWFPELGFIRDVNLIDIEYFHLEILKFKG